MLKIYNTLTRKTEEFQTLEPNLVKMYVCGVTVYNDAHVGHAMSALVFDIIRRYLEYRGYTVKHVMNYTDVDDKIINRAKQLNEDPLKLSQRYIEDYAADLKSLNVLPATSNPQVSKTMPLIIQFIEGLIQKEHAYAASNGDVYFRVTSDDDYGRLSGRKLDDMQAGARIEVGEAKDHPMDFALWKAAKPGEISWDSPWGKGRPGWHIECSAMNLAELGEQIDIHGGGNDLIFPHHENEIAQSESYTGKEFSRYWVHNGMLQLGGEKMSKSLGNIISIKDFLSKRSADVMRMLVLNGTYRAPLLFNDDTLDAAEKNVERLKSALRPASASAKGLSAEALSTLASAADSAKANFTEAMDNDFNTAGAIAALFELSKAINTARDNGATSDQLKSAQSTFSELAAVLGLKLEEKQGSSEVEAQVNALIAERTEARKQKQWALSDQLRDKLKELGVTIEDSKDGTTWRWG
ncbi:MAG: cysteine--tRNA ligase [Anaerolineales bacterium]|uniref:cysteine--tRNA ligase n=1 Tax=Candidatus Villigracilis affinis TaxID=3140682 RepID=UPI001D1DF2CF|nr:cysteine--tRNA ligase [Anaerolineales bacterium]MBK9603986.1 cysteine--tRNA ligase [Anaerolineales bacterium]